MRLNDKQPRHRLWVNNKERHLPLDLDNADLPTIKDTTKQTTVNITPPPAAAKPDNYKPPHRRLSKQPPPISNKPKPTIVAQLDDVQAWWQYKEDLRAGREGRNEEGALTTH
eukprot:1015544-Amphidinium_carterae.2